MAMAQIFKLVEHFQSSKNLATSSDAPSVHLQQQNVTSPSYISQQQIEMHLAGMLKLLILGLCIF